MANNTRQASGTMELRYEWNESSSGHVEHTHEIILSAQGATVILQEVTNTTNFIKNNESDSSNVSYVIPVSLLISLIKDNGTRQ
ncbi:hypothetical protein RZ631_001725 [Proteus mirabilis]|uniref:hypothetical protein n=1 Tax=Proteus mirabilis TaxID=584 RepID=UPI001BA3F329|nr:hypothetical protein [Proteus mirabilis]ELN4570757.1 hypothetical protein [Proteus mirabilis]HBC6707940.1 hypothetical protein [Proteus mirabilis]HEK2627317.1 hypothetical protein [Proteus mirabilis]